MKRVCVYCGSNYGSSSDYLEAARALAKALFRTEIFVWSMVVQPLVLWGKLLTPCLLEGGEVIGIIPESFAGLGNFP